jgi:hypothetical protein
MLKWLYLRPWSERWMIPIIDQKDLSIASLRALSDGELERIEKIYKATRKRQKESLASKRSINQD